MNTEEIVDGKPAIIHHYNETKGGTDTFDMLCKNYSVVKRSNRWPLRVFWGMLDQAIVNSRILLKCQNSLNGDESKVTARDCLKKIIFHLAKPWLSERQMIPTLQNNLKMAIAAILRRDHEHGIIDEEDGFLATKKRCMLCPSKKDKKTRYQCIACLRPMCMDHRAKLCNQCACTD